MYKFVKPLLFTLDAETSHRLVLKALKFLSPFWPTNSDFNLPVNIMGINFPHPIGLAAGLDKDGDYIQALAALNFAFIEIGTVTPLPQSGNPKPRLFRLNKEEAIINRMGFNSKGVEYVVKRLQQTNYQGILGINIGKNASTPLDQAHQDYLYGFEHLAPFASYITINISSPNTLGLRRLQQGENLTLLLSTLKEAQAKLHKYIPLVVKLAPDLSWEELEETAAILLENKIDGVIATNTTLSRKGVENSIYASEVGGLSGTPLRSLSTNVLSHLHHVLGDKIPLIASGGITSPEAAVQKIQAGAKLIQLYSGLIFQGPGLIRQCYSTVTDFAKFRG